MKVKFILASLLFVVFYFFSSVPSLALQPFQTNVGDEQILLGPTSTLLDNPFATIKYSSGIKAFSGTGPTYSFSGTNLDNLVQNPGINLPLGGTASYDECTANINSLYIDPSNSSHWIAWYHAEGVGAGKSCTANLHVKSMAAAESNDSGNSWIKLGQVIRGNENDEGEGDGKVIVLGNYFYMFYNKAVIATNSSYSHTARAPLSSLGKPGNWSKYYNGSWNESGINGNESPIPLPFGTSYVSYNSYLKRLILILATGKWGFFLYYTNQNPTEPDIVKAPDGTNSNGWVQAPNMIYPLVSYTQDLSVDDWTADLFIENPQLKSLYAYPSIIGLDGDGSISGQTFYLYYMKLFPGERFYTRYLMRRKITFNSSPSDAFDAKVDLIRYEKQNPTRIRVSTETTKSSQLFSKTQIIGQLLSYLPQPQTDFQAVYDCSIPSSGDYMLSIRNPYPTSAPNNLDTWRHCESDGDQFIRTIGYAAVSPTTPFTTPLYRCFDQPNSNHFASTDSGCEGKQKEFLIGYIQGTVQKTEFGFNTHVSAAGFNLNLTTFKNNVDELVANNQKWVRFNIPDFEVATSGTTTAINWNLANFSVFDQAIDYARTKGLKIFLVTNVPYYANQYSVSDYQSVARIYYQFLANRYKGKISIWQVFTEPDLHNFRTYSIMTGIDSAYINELNGLVAIARTEIKNQDPNTLVTLNVSGYPLTDQIQNRWYQVFDVIAPNLDLISLNPYPDPNNLATEIPLITTRINNVRNRYGKPVAVSETGTCNVTEAWQKTYLPQYINSAKSASPNPLIVYELQDEALPTFDACESTYGIKKIDGTRKAAYSDVMNAMGGTVATLVGDINHDGKVDLLDLARIVNARTVATINPFSGPEDFNGDGKLDASDLSVFLLQYTHL